MPTKKIQDPDEPVKEKKPYITRISAAELEEKIELLIQMGIPFRKESTKGRSVLHAEQGWGSWMNKESSFRASELSFIKNVKAYIKKHETWRAVRNNFTDKEGNIIQKKLGKIKYFYYSKKLKAGDYFENIIEIDLKNAYWDTAFKMGLFDERIYQKGLTVTKKSRLAAVGSFAKVVKVFEFDGKIETVKPPIKEDEIEFLWHTISYRVGRLMAKAMRLIGNDFLFFWVDAIFIKPGKEKQIIKLFKEAGFNCSTIKCEWMQVNDKKIIVKSTAKAKWVYKIKEEKVIIDGKPFMKRYRTKKWVDERPFNLDMAMDVSEIMTLATQ